MWYENSHVIALLVCFLYLLKVVIISLLIIKHGFTSFAATLFGQVWRLEPLPPEKKAMWRREIEWLLCVSDHIVELTPTWQTFPDGSKLEVQLCTYFHNGYMCL